MKKFLLIASALFVFGMSGNAQVQENPVASSTTSDQNAAPASEGAKSFSGGMYVKYQFNNAYYKGESEPFRNIAVGIHLFDSDLKCFEFGCQLSYFSHGNKQDVAGHKMETTTTMWRLSLPYKLGYRFKAGKKSEIFPYGTFEIAWNITGSVEQKYRGDSDDWSIFSKKHMGDGAKFEHFTFPVGIGMKAYFDRLQIGVEYIWDFMLQSDYTHSGFGLSVGFLF